MGVTEAVIGWGGAGRGFSCRLGAPDWGPMEGRVRGAENRTFLGIWTVWIRLLLLTRHISRRGYPGGDWGQSQPPCAVKTAAPGSPAETVDTKDYGSDSKEIFRSEPVCSVFRR